jgi:hypothetical protein
MLGLFSMRSRNDGPGITNFNFGVDSVFTNQRGNNAGLTENEFLLLDEEQFLLLDGTDFLLLGI